MLHFLSTLPAGKRCALEQWLQFQSHWCENDMLSMDFIHRQVFIFISGIIQFAKYSLAIPDNIVKWKIMYIC